MKLRCVSVLLGFAVGFLLGRDVLSQDAVRVLLVGLGFVAASILPTVTLLVNGLTSTGRSVMAVNELHCELVGTVRRLFDVLKLAVGSVLLLLPFPYSELLRTFSIGPISVVDPIGKLFSALAVICVVLMVFALREIPAAIYRSLELRKSIAIDEARQRNADRIGQVDASVVFHTQEGFGDKVARRVDA